MTQLHLPIDSDLLGAEDLAGVLARALHGLMTDGSFETQAKAIDALAEFSGYCRPSCGFLDDGECHSVDPDGCGCICGHEDGDDPLHRDKLRP